jgi:hypothetical protein
MVSTRTSRALLENLPLSPQPPSSRSCDRSASRRQASSKPSRAISSRSLCLGLGRLSSTNLRSCAMNPGRRPQALARKTMPGAVDDQREPRSTSQKFEIFPLWSRAMTKYSTGSPRPASCNLKVSRLPSGIQQHAAESERLLPSQLHRFAHASWDVSKRYYLLVASSRTSLLVWSRRRTLALSCKL